MPDIINSVQNAKIKTLISLKNPRARKKHKLFTIEGEREIARAVTAQYTLVQVFFCPTITEDKTWLEMGIPSQVLIAVSGQVFEKIAYRKTTGGAVAVAQYKSHTLERISLSKQPLLIVLHAIEKPGNLGALIRTAEAADADAVLVCDPQIDLYNPNVIRASMGYIFTRQVIIATSEQTLLYLQKNHIKIYTTSLQGGTPYRQVNYKQPCALVMGSESTGVSDDWKKPPMAQITIPMRGNIDSLNVSVTAAIIIFEALRQREK